MKTARCFIYMFVGTRENTRTHKLNFMMDHCEVTRDDNTRTEYPFVSVCKADWGYTVVAAFWIDGQLTDSLIGIKTVGPDLHVY